MLGVRQGRLPIRVELKALSQRDLYRILTGARPPSLCASPPLLSAGRRLNGVSARPA